MRSILRSMFAITIAIALGSAAGVARAEPHLVSREGQAMGTVVRFAVWTDDDQGAQRAIDAGFDEIRRIEALMTTWSPTSEVSQINAHAGIAAVHVSDETLEVIEM